MIGAVAIVLAAMYMLRLISAVLHQDVGPAVSDAALDLRRGELAIARAAGRDPARALGLAERDQRALVRQRARLPCRRSLGSRGARPPVPAAEVHRVIHKPHVDWFALSPTLALLAAAGAAAARRRLRRRRSRPQAGLARSSAAPAS